MLNIHIIQVRIFKSFILNSIVILNINSKIKSFAKALTLKKEFIIIILSSVT